MAMKPLAATWEDAQLSSQYMSPIMDLFTDGEKQATLDRVQEFMSGKTGGAGDIDFAGDCDLLAYVKPGTIALILARVNYSIDNPAGTGSLAGESIGSISVSHTMAYNNAPWDEFLRGNIFGKDYYQLLEDASPSFGWTV